jgi:branched-chain amino acid transport system substrate-binding protein
MITTSLDRDSKAPAMRKFIDEYEAKFKAPADMVAASTHTALHVAAEGLKRAGGEDPAKVRSAIAGLKDFQVATGRITFNELGEIYKPAQIQVVKGGKFRHFATIDDPVLLAAPTK